MPTTYDSNATSLRLAKMTNGALTGSEVWYPLQPNSYSDFGSTVKTVAREPITEGRQRLKGVVVDKEASAGFEHDFVQDALTPVLEGLMFAAWRSKVEAAPSAVSSTVYTLASTTGAVVGGLVYAQGFAVAGNNGLKKLTAVTGTTLAASGLATETPPATALVTQVGVEAGSGDVTLTNSGGVVTIGSTTLDFTTLGLIAGEWIFVGGDATANKFATAANNGFYRIESIAAHAIICDRYPTSPVTDNGSGKTIRIFFGHVIKNEADASLIVKNSYMLERKLTASQFEYISPCVVGRAEMRVTTGDKVTFNTTFGAGSSSYEGSAKSGTRPDVVSEGAFNGTSHVVRLRMLNDETNASLFSYVTDFSLTIDNGLSPLKAVSVLGNLDQNAGDFMVSGSATAYFTSTEACEAIEANTDVSFDFGLVRNNCGHYFDLPLVTIGDARITVTKNQPITLPISVMAAAHPTLNHTMLVVKYRYLPDLAESALGV